MRSVIIFAALALAASLIVPRYAAHMNGTRRYARGTCRRMR